MTRIVPMLVVSGSMGSGKTTLLSEVSDLLEEADISHAAIDLDWLSKMYSSQGQYGERLMFANLAAVWPVYAAAGAERLVVARVVENRSDIRQYRLAVPGAEPIVCLLTCSIEEMQKRVRIREPGMIQAEAVVRSKTVSDILDQARAEDFKVDNGQGRSITDVGREVLSLAGWL